MGFTLDDARPGNEKQPRPADAYGLHLKGHCRTILRHPTPSTATAAFAGIYTLCYFTLSTTWGHIRQIMELYRAHAFYPEMGVFKNYYKINP
jgi:hypothetical protein